MQTTDDAESKESKDDHDQEYSSTKFQFRSDVNFDQWMKSKNKYEWQFRNEIAIALHVRPVTVSFHDYRRGSVIGTVCLIVAIGIGICFGITYCNSETSKSGEAWNDYRRDMRVQDQIEVKYDGAWYKATICKIEEYGTVKRFTVRYNPKDNAKGWDPFWPWWNTEKFEWKNNKLYGDERLRYPGKSIKRRNAQGEDEEVYWRAPDPVQRQSVEEIQINDHIFVKFNDGWRRSKVYQRERTVWIEVKDLTEGRSKTLKLSKKDDIEFRDMRDYDEQVLKELRHLKVID